MLEGLSMVHIVIIAVIALIVLGPEKFPEYAKIALRAYRDLQAYINGIKRDIGDEIHPISRELNQLSRYNPEDYIEKLTEAVSSIADDKPTTEEAPKVEDAPKTAEPETPAAPAGVKTEPAETAPTPSTPVPPPAGEYDAFVAKGSTPANDHPAPEAAAGEPPNHAGTD